MIRKYKDSSETYQHICDNRKHTPIPVLIHDIHAYLALESGQDVHVKYCPWCGVDIDKEANGNG